MGGIVSSVEGVANSFVSLFTGSNNPGPEDYSSAIGNMVSIATQIASKVFLDAPKSAQQLAVTPEKGHPSIVDIKIANLLDACKCNSDGVLGDAAGTTNGFPNTAEGLKDATTTLEQSLKNSAIQAIGIQSPEVANSPIFATGFGSGKFSPTDQTVDLEKVNDNLELALNGLPDRAREFCINFVGTNLKSLTLGSEPLINVSQFFVPGDQFVYHIGVVAAASPPRGTGFSTASAAIAVKTGFT